MKNLNDYLSYLNQLNPAKIDLGLSRVFEVARPLALLEFSCPVITVAGTNGKGSVVRTLETIFHVSGYKTGAYTSPHISRFNERIRFNNAEISDEELIESLVFIEKNRGSTQLSFFEFTTLAAFHFYQRKQADVLIFEVGLGGRLDAVNSLDPDIAVITSIDFDHMEWLGTTREAIGFEKAAIARAQKPLVFMDRNIPDSVKQYAKKIGAELIQAGKDYFQDGHDPWAWKGRTSEWKHLPMPHLKLQNVAGALMVIELLQTRLPVSSSHIREGLKAARLEGRFEYTQQAGLVLDVAHNPASAEWLARQIKRQHPKGKKYAVFSMLKDKDIAASILPFVNLIDLWLIPVLEAPRAETPEKITEILSAHGVKKWYNFSAVSGAISWALKEYDASNDLIIVFGSFHTVEKAKQYLNGVNQNGS